MKLFSGECHKTSLMKSQNWFSQWLGAIRQQAISWTNVDPDLCCHMALLGNNSFSYYKLQFGAATELTHWGLVMPIRRQRSGSTLAQVMVWCLMAPRHYLNQCWLIISKAPVTHSLQPVGDLLATKISRGRREVAGWLQGNRRLVADRLQKVAGTIWSQGGFGCCK